MNTNSNSYTFIYASVLVILSAAALAFVSEVLKPVKQSNINTEKRLNILTSAHLATDAAGAPNKNGYVANQFEKYITNAYVVNGNGEVVSGNAFDTEMKQQYELLKEMAVAAPDVQNNLKKELRLPVFECSLDNGTLLYIVQCYGSGLWGPLWGYIALRDDCNTIHGAVFDHKGETPGLGSDIATAKYAQQFDGKMLFDTDGRFVSIAVVKGGTKPNDKHAIDAISGGTLTSNGLQDMLFSCLEAYTPFFNIKSKQ
jgi:Na+-transporting NADH:ubiquinone oxidoreductase subunit C